MSPPATRPSVAAASAAVTALSIPISWIVWLYARALPWPPSIDIEPAVKPSKPGICKTFAKPTLIKFWQSATIPQKIKYRMRTLPPKRSNFNDAPRPIVVKKAIIKKFWIKSESNLIVTISKDCSIATTIAKISPPITGAGIHNRCKIETWLTIKTPSKNNNAASASVVIASNSIMIHSPFILNV